MDYLILLVVLVVGATALDDPRKQATLMIMNNCKSNVGATDEDVEALINKKLPTSHEGQCLLECLLTRGNMMKDGKFNKKGFLASTKAAMKGDSEKIQKIAQIADECEKEIESSQADHCEISKMIVQCTSQKGKSIGFKFPSRL